MEKETSSTAFIVLYSRWKRSLTAPVKPSRPFRWWYSFDRFSTLIIAIFHSILLFPANKKARDFCFPGSVFLFCGFYTFALTVLRTENTPSPLVLHCLTHTSFKNVADGSVTIRRIQSNI